ncbi:hypothetical protein [Sphingomonas sp. dw_22]|uniref:hypothetical protein n=1 Tax=Sphingomonas sp. dw_22 TaxID=2721175 RepID=UPI001BD604FE
MNALAHKVAWQAPRPLWRGMQPQQQPQARAPQLLRFASDDFMDQLLATLAEAPARISDRIARFETWRDPPQPADLTDPIVRVPLPAPMQAAKRGRLLRAPVTPPPTPNAQRRLKLYQPAQQRYYVVAGTLACAIPGLPERSLAGGHETVHFVLRRLMPAPGDGEKAEYAFVKQGDEARWQKLAAGTDLAPGEELLPLFPLQHRDEEGRPRTLWGGLVPVARREEYLAQQVVTTPVPLAQGQADALRPPPAPAPVNSTYARTARLRLEVSEPWKAMMRTAIRGTIDLNESVPDGLPDQPAAAAAARIFAFNIQFQMQSWLLLLDLRLWIEDHLPALKTALATGTPPAAGTPARKAWDVLDSATAANLVTAMRDPDHPDDDLKPMAASMRAALTDILGFKDLLDNAATHYTPSVAKDATKRQNWPDFHFPLVGLTVAGGLEGPWATILTQTDPVNGTLDTPGTSGDEVQGIATPRDVTPNAPPALPNPEDLDRFTATLARALPVQPETDVQPIPHAMRLRDVMLKTAGDGGLFVIRMVHVNADCGPLHPPTLSEPSERFELASFFDPEAPVRPITITLPTDTSPAGLRKHGRGAAFVMSDMLCGQVQRAKGLGFIDLVLQVLPWPFHKDIEIGDGGGCKNNGLEIGMICSLSIPIITLCALILLIIIVTLLDFIFRWLPWFICCFPVPKLKGKPA